MSTRESTNKENDEEYTEEDSGVSNRSYNLLKAEYEKCRQELYDSKRKLELNDAMLREVHEANEAVERSLGQQISEKDKIVLEEREKHRVTTVQYENIISDLETTLAKQTTEIQELRQRINQQEESVAHVTTTDESANISLETNNPSLQHFIDELETLLQKEKRKSEHAGEEIKRLQTRCNESEHISRILKEQLDQKNRALEDARAELEARAEAVALETDSIRDSRKGNSLFGEVEDRRQKVVDKMNTLREKYIEAKRICKAQMAEIKMLKTERATTLAEWKNHTDHTLATNDELIQKYKHRISDLETKLKSEMKRKEDTKESHSIDASFGYFQSLLDAKKKETNELRIKIEDLSTQLLLQEETKLNITKELQHWRYKASILEAQACASQGKLKSDFTNNAERNVSSEELKHDDDTRTVNYDKMRTVSMR